MAVLDKVPKEGYDSGWHLLASGAFLGIQLVTKPEDVVLGVWPLNS